MKELNNSTLANVKKRMAKQRMTKSVRLGVRNLDKREFQNG
jgi:hypothetical protein